MAYYSLEPWGEERADLRAGIIGAITANVWRGKDDPPVRPADLVPDFLGERKQQERVGAVQRLLAWARRIGGANAKEG